MNHLNTRLTVEELESLSKACLECRLSKLQEKELEFILLSSDVSSPIIDEARETLALTTALASSSKPVQAAARRRPRLFKWIAAAACIAVVAGFGVRHIANTHTDSSIIIVFEDGKRLSADLAAKKAAETQAMCMMQLKKTMAEARQVQLESTKSLN
ncbi:MAG: hypothetical protein HDS65_00860 [Bacteroidales bacterium]|nr:hypothetical protein [Bacteroidales bacterium]